MSKIIVDQIQGLGSENVNVIGNLTVNGSEVLLNGVASVNSDFQNGRLVITDSLGQESYVDLTGYLDDTNDFVSSASFNSSTGTVSLLMNSGSTVAFNIDGRYLLSSTVVPNANISESSVTQHESALTITESQIDDLKNYALSQELSDESLFRTQADEVLQDNIDAEESARITADNNLQSLITGVSATIVNNYVPYTGASQDVDLALNSIAASAFKVAGLANSDGTITWNEDEGCVNIQEGNTVLQVGQEIYVHVRNSSATETIPNGTPVYVTGTLGASGRLLVAPMIADGSIEGKYFIGVSTEDIAPDSDGKVTWFGKVRSFDTGLFSEGQTLYVSETIAGQWQTTMPQAPNPKLEVAIAINSTNNGTIFVRGKYQPSLSNINDVEIENISTGDIIQWNATNNRWENSTALVDEISTRQAADDVLQANIDAEEAQRVLQDGILQGQIDTNDIDIQANADAIAQEVIDRSNADDTLQGNIDAEILARTNADNTLQGNITAEETARIAADDALQSQIDGIDLSPYQLISEKGQAEGYASLDVNAKVPVSQLPDSIVGQLQYEGTWDANTNTPTLADATTVKGHYYVVSVEGTYETILYHVGDWIVSNGTVWEKVDNTDAVTSVFGRLGNVVANESDYSGFYPLIQDLNDEVNARITADNALQTQIDALDNSFTATGLQEVTDINNTTTNQINIAGLNSSGDVSVGTDVFFVDVSGKNVGINTTVAPDAIGGGLAIYRTDYPVLSFRNQLSGDTSESGLKMFLVNSDFNYFLGENGDQIFSTNGVEAARITSTGNLEVVGNITSSQLSINGGTSSQFLKADGSVDSNVYITSADVIPANDATITISAGTGITGGGTFTVNQSTDSSITINHADTSTQPDIVGVTNTFIDGVTLDTYGHVTGLTTQSVTIPSPNNATVTITAGSQLTGGGSFTVDQSNNSEITINHGDTSTLDGNYGFFGDRPYQITVDPNGHVVAVSTSGLVGNSGGGIEIQAPIPGFDFQIAHADTSTQSNITPVANTFINGVTLDDYGHITGVTTAEVPPVDLSAINQDIIPQTTNVFNVGSDEKKWLNGFFSGDVNVGANIEIRPSNVTMGSVTQIESTVLPEIFDDLNFYAGTNEGQIRRLFVDFQGIFDLFADPYSVPQNVADILQNNIGEKFIIDWSTIIGGSPYNFTFEGTIASASYNGYSVYITYNTVSGDDFFSQGIYFRDFYFTNNNPSASDQITSFRIKVGGGSLELLTLDNETIEPASTSGILLNNERYFYENETLSIADINEANYLGSDDIYEISFKSIIHPNLPNEEAIYLQVTPTSIYSNITNGYNFFRPGSTVRFTNTSINQYLDVSIEPYQEGYATNGLPSEQIFEDTPVFRYTVVGGSDLINYPKLSSLGTTFYNYETNLTINLDVAKEIKSILKKVDGENNKYEILDLKSTLFSVGDTISYGSIESYLRFNNENSSLSKSITYNNVTGELVYDGISQPIIIDKAINIIATDEDYKFIINYPFVSNSVFLTGRDGNHSSSNQVIIGTFGSGSSNGTQIGYNVQYASNGVSLGYNCRGNNNGIAIGYNTTVYGSQQNSVVIKRNYSMRTSQSFPNRVLVDNVYNYSSDRLTVSNLSSTPRFVYYYYGNRNYGTSFSTLSDNILAWIGASNAYSFPLCVSLKYRFMDTSGNYKIGEKQYVFFSFTSFIQASDNFNSGGSLSGGDFLFNSFDVSLNNNSGSSSDICLRLSSGVNNSATFEYVVSAQGQG